MNALPSVAGYAQTGIILAVFACSSSLVIGDVKQDVLEAWRKRQADARTIDVSWKGRDTALARSMNPPVGKPGPQKTQSYDSAGRCVWDAQKKRLRIETNQFVVNRDGEMSRVVAVKAFDGKVSKNYTLQSQLTELGGPPSIHIRNDQTFSHLLRDVKCLPLRLVYGGLDRIKDTYQVIEPMFSSVREEAIDGRQCLHLRLTPKNVGAGNEEHFWLDKQRDYLPVSFTIIRRNQRTNNDDLGVQVDITYEERGGRFSPKSWTIAWLFREGVPSLVMNADVTKLTTNEPVPFEQFRFDGYPTGMYVVDDPKGQTYTKGEKE